MREFSDSIKYSVVRENLEKNNGRICCEICGRELKNISEGHFDHVEPYSKGGQSVKANCQILCSNCNLKKNDKELSEFLLDEKARKFLDGISSDETVDSDDFQDKSYVNAADDISKEKFDKIVGDFIAKEGNISKVDFSRVYNNLPPIKYLYMYYGDLSKLKEAFNLNNSIVWNRENIIDVLKKYIEVNGDLYQKNLKASNNLPSYPCIMKHFPEYSGLDELKSDLFKLDVRTKWTKELALERGRDFVKEYGKVTLKDLVLENGLPTSKVIYKYFGNLENYQLLIGSIVSKKNEVITIFDIDEAVKCYLSDKGNEFYNTKDFFSSFPISSSVIYRNFGNLESFYDKYNIRIINKKKGKFTKQEIDDIILKYIKDGKPIPSVAKELTQLGLPSRDAIMKYYRNWKEPFVLFSKLYDKIN